MRIHIGFAPDALPDDLVARLRALPHDVGFGEDGFSNLSAEDQAPEAEVIFGQPPLAALTAGPARWVQLTSAGWSRYDLPEVHRALRARGAILSTASTVYADPCAEHALALVLASNRLLAEAWQTAPAWNSHGLRARSRLLRGSHVLVLGHGAIARRLLSLLAPFEVRATVLRRRPDGNEAAEVVSPDALPGLLPGVDVVVNTLPGTPATEGLVSRAFLAALPPHAVLINVGRGTTVDQDALVDALHAGQLGAAYLDVTEPEPLPPDHPLWTAPRCRITPHTAGGQVAERRRLVEHFLANLERLKRGEAVRDVVAPEVR